MSDHPRLAQAPIRLLLVVALVLPLLAGCGKRPALVDAPDNDEPHHFPQTYPDITTDPRPAAAK